MENRKCGFEENRATSKNKGNIEWTFQVNIALMQGKVQRVSTFGSNQSQLALLRNCLKPLSTTVQLL